jgi:O-antigen/teichoic acid export membrane protein
LRNAAFTFAIRVAGAGAAIGLQILLARLMGADSYGLYVIAWTWMLALGSVVSLGLADAAMRFVPRYVARGRAPQAARFFRTGVGSVTLAGLLLATAGAGILQVLPLDRPLLALVTVVAVGLPFVAFEYFLEGMARSLGWFRLTGIAIYIVRPMLIAVACLALHGAGVGLTAPLVGTVTILAVAATGLTTYLTLAMHLRPATGPRRPAGRLRRLWLGAALPMLVVSSLDDLFPALDVMLVGALLGPAEAAIYFAAGRLLALAHFAQYAVHFVNGHAMSLALAGNAEQSVARCLQRATAVSALATLVALGATLAAGPFLLGLFGQNFVHGYAAMCLLAVGLLGRSLAVPAQEYLLLSGRNRVLTRIGAITLAVLAVLCAVLAPAFGLTGAATAAAIAQLLRSLLLIRATRRMGGLLVLPPLRLGRQRFVAAPGGSQ